MPLKKRFRNEGTPDHDDMPDVNLPDAPQSRTSDDKFLTIVDKLSESYEIDRNALYETYKNKKGVLAERFNNRESISKAGGIGIFGGLFSSFFMLGSTLEAIETSKLTEAPYISGPIFALCAWMYLSANKEGKKIKRNTREEVKKHLRALPPPKSI
jgi:hypothetical protein